ncbi:MAG TPA: NADH-quinone oxidoreductase subunit C, partial [Vicinamibacterales bacterium]|nr:NADH-quinone oxidoreductase subunit C [Vicinamibacterales bacterium]
MSAATATQPLLDRFPAGAIVAEEGRDQPTWRVDRAVLADLARALRDDPKSRFDTLLDLCGVDYPERDERFEAVYHLYS